MLNRTRNHPSRRSHTPRNGAGITPPAPRPDAGRYADLESRWRAVRDRDDRADGAFIFAVRTTGVYCRPTCRSRRPLRRNVRFFETAADARREGFRPCKRCAPDDTSPVDPHHAIILNACRRIDAGATPPLAELARDAGLTPWHFQRVFKRLVGVSPKQYAIARRVQRFQDRLTPETTVMDAALDAGFSSTARAYAVAGPRLGMSPSARRRGGRGERIRSTVVDSPLGPMLVAATDKGVCRVAFGRHADELIRALRTEFPHADHVADAPGVKALARRMLNLIPPPSTRSATSATPGARSTARNRKPPKPRNPGAFDPPLDVEGTAFQLRVWEALRRIAPGRTTTYGQLARELGRPRSARAVGRACAANPVALLIPCHRVVPSDSGTGEYRWGRNRKQRLLILENAAPTP
ncbi:MAG: methylated-DNA--[protein]-cysteine S-methyltransferase [Phycisphaerae bacterium]|nr:MAG: methylated-DNA--[protein]-cysteine S-methyltransferase [Planctomycetota bacterium]KAB2949753.1 MAG: methylated-DNA--[protein]-cysteine S-methyltransferase [Phycisphaerae bacterium]MBE7457530.1 methylated-DNA--[protein]-cysteine S-methyltransferase [Planctomycetia bacterium]MCL4718906.1 methylated-DNA--[protein]-cysteine S-methyltransferase [Phycisphaerae bacterium]MCQ3921659.1 bifunctional transcriptional activator/DNA repair enzyme protein Ada [Planctomycetota bacterium]